MWSETEMEINILLDAIPKCVSTDKHLVIRNRCKNETIELDLGLDYSTIHYCKEYKFFGIRYSKPLTFSIRSNEMDYNAWRLLMDAFNKAIFKKE